MHGTAAIAISNAVDLRQRDAREARYMEIVGRYDRETVEMFPRVLAELTLAILSHLRTKDPGAGYVSDFPDLLRRLCWHPPRPVDEDSVAAALTAGGARPWQVELLGRDLTAALRAASA